MPNEIEEGAAGAAVETGVPAGEGEESLARAMMEEMGIGAKGDPTTPAAPESPAAAETTPPAAEGEPPPVEEPAGPQEKRERTRLTPEQQAAVDSRIGEVVAKRKAVERELEEERSHAKTRDERISELERQLEETEQRSRQGLGVPPAFLAESEAEIEAREEYLWSVEKKLDAFRETGLEGEDKNGPYSYTAEQVRERILNVREERERVLPRARQVLTRRQEYEAQVRQVYPDLTDARSETAAEAARLFREIPGLRARADARLLVGDMIAGRKAREERQRKAGTAPRAPTVGPVPTPGARSRIDAPPQRGYDGKRLREQGHSQDALEGEMNATMARLGL